MLANSRISGEKHQGVALWNIDGIGTEVLELHLGILEVLEVDGDADAGVASNDVVLATIVIDESAGLHDVARVLVLSRVNDC